ncbi:FYVE-domain-containing protein [Pleomassaria siparia CBS 279.74]|uniref:RING-type E3 ubiquitin transferase n=1 Tax=Pleomassaria siparia CBS 279.74 TaxID=1314801 RepID=A0A6G1K5F5_9PLEO|nr:FYVE-domain-containing protein [Pleomassaria siparia CBS 279.74]
MHPSRNRSHGGTTSHFLTQPPNGRGGQQTWVDFLRESVVDGNLNGSPPNNSGMLPPVDNSRPRGGPSRFTLPAHPSRTHSIEQSSRTNLIQQSSRTARGADRKRRLTTPESPMRRPSSIRMRPDAAPAASGSSSDPILVDSSPAPQSRPQLPPSFPSQTSSSSARPVRRESESSIVLPQWQPDADVSHCPVCGSQFTFFYRKHHCRKCGRVVCSACSPHRITIPRQFIVHPPSDPTSGIIDLTGEDDGNNMSAFGPFRNPALGGGEEVRVCNPCVPDPNYEPPPQYTLSPSQHYSTQSLSPIRPNFPPRNTSLQGHGLGHPRGHRSSQSVQDGSQTVGHGQSQRPRDAFGERALTFLNSTRTADLWPPTQVPQHGYTPSQPPQYYQQQPSHNMNPHQRTSSNSGTPINDSGNMHRPNLAQRFMSPVVHHEPVQRRQIAEEDECPICGNELPPKGPTGDDADRVEHVEYCIAMHSSSPPQLTSNNQTSTSLPSQRTRGMSNVASLSGNGEGASNMNRMSHSARGMVQYKATEKDCTDDDGEPAECVICFEEFETGDDMGRLVCWCKFHERCIRQWWEKKGRGACPTHQLHE